MLPIEPPCKIPLNPQAPLHNKALLVSIAGHMKAHPHSDLIASLTGKITFEQALTNAKPDYVISK